MSDHALFNLIAIPAVLFQLLLLVFFAVRRWARQTALRWGWLVYALSLPAFGVSMVSWRQGIGWPFWLGGCLYLFWGILGYVVEYVLAIDWRSPPRWPVFVPYVLLYLGTCMFYWWPQGLLSRRLWLILGILFAVSSALNISSHHKRRDTASD